MNSVLSTTSGDYLTTIYFAGDDSTTDVFVLFQIIMDTCISHYISFAEIQYEVLFSKLM